MRDRYEIRDDQLAFRKLRYRMETLFFLYVLYRSLFGCVSPAAELLNIKTPVLSGK